MIDVKTEGLSVRFLPNAKKDFVLLDDHKILNHIIPKGFVSDGASFIDESNAVRAAAVLHDYYYRTTNHGYSRKKVDQMFYCAMLDLGVPRMEATKIWMGVRFGGGRIWVNNKKKYN